MVKWSICFAFSFSSFFWGAWGQGLKCNNFVRKNSFRIQLDFSHARVLSIVNNQGFLLQFLSFFCTSVDLFVVSAHFYDSQVYLLKVEGIAFRFLPDPIQIKNALEASFFDLVILLVFWQRVVSILCYILYSFTLYLNFKFCKNTNIYKLGSIDTETATPFFKK